MAFNLKEVVNFIEAAGFHVEAADEILDEDPGVIEGFKGPVIRAIQLTITPYEDRAPEKKPRGKPAS